MAFKVLCRGPSSMYQSSDLHRVSELDRPLRRLVWVIPASISLWALMFAGFAYLLKRPQPAPQLKPLEVSLGEIPGGNGGTLNKSGAGSKSAAAAPGLPSKSAPAARSAVKPPVHAASAGWRASTPARSRHRHPSHAARPAPAADDEGDFIPRPSPRDSAETAPADSASGQGTSNASSSASIGSDAASAGPGAGSSGGGDGSGGSQVFTDVDHPPVPIATVLPQYPGAARARGIEGEVVLRAVVDQHGAVEDRIAVVQSIPMLDRAAIEALRKWRFEPGRDAGGRAVRVEVEVPMRFRLRQAAEGSAK